MIEGMSPPMVLSSEDKRGGLYGTLLLSSLDKRSVFDNTFFSLAVGVVTNFWRMQVRPQNRNVNWFTLPRAAPRSELRAAERERKRCP